MKKLFLSLFFLIFIQLLGFSQSFLKTNGKAIVNENGDTVQIRAMGLGGWMLQEGYMLQTSDFANAQFEIRAKIEDLIGEEDTQLFYDKWLQNHTSKSDVDSMASWGFNAVRLPMHYKLFTLPIEDEPVPGEHTWLTKGFELTDSLISWCKANDMYVLLDLHAAPGGQGYESAISDYDPSKPSLWERKANRDKTKALWKKLAERYADEPTVMGYDLLNEPNWNIPGNALLRQLYKEITDSIRSVDTRHMIFIEGNWFANDFTGLTPPWDDNMVYSPHKYWSFNDQGSIHWVIAIRDAYNIPIFFGESGENSNSWFTEAIRLFEDNGLGWAWWPLKKIESISCPLSIVKTPEYETLLEYWKGNTNRPSAAFAKATLLELTENLKTENCIFQKDVIDAMFRQVYDLSTKPFYVHNIPGVIYASDYCMGRQGIAYFDDGFADYHLSTNSYTAWNQGWAYRNDGVDIEKIPEGDHSNGYGIGWIGTGEWMKYDIKVTEPGLYDAKLRVASNSSNGLCHFETNNSPVSPLKTIPNTGGWQTWSYVTIPDIVLSPTDSQIVFFADREGFNLSSFEFIRKGNSSDIQAQFLQAKTVDSQTIKFSINKAFKQPLPGVPAGISIHVNSVKVNILDINPDPNNPRSLLINIENELKSSDMIRISYSGNLVYAEDGTLLQAFSNKIVENTLIIYHPIPGKIEAEDYYHQVGLALENCTDAGGGQNIAYLGSGDYAEYYVNVNQAGTYNVEYRTAALNNNGKITLQLVEDDNTFTDLHTVNFSPTGGWQSWKSTFETLDLPKGQHKLRLLIQASDFNINWFNFSFLSPTTDQGMFFDFKVYPNPSTGRFEISADLPAFKAPPVLKIINEQGMLIEKLTIIPDDQNFVQQSIDLTAYPNGLYYLGIEIEGNLSRIQPLLKTSAD
jgi:hypothetical protein